MTKSTDLARSTEETSTSKNSRETVSEELEHSFSEEIVSEDQLLGAEEIHFRTMTLLLSIMLLATNGVIYELLIAGYSSYLLGDSITQFSLTIGVFMSSMGVGSWLTQHFETDLELRFIQVELWLAFLGGPTILFLALGHIYTRIYVWIMFAFIVALGILIGFEIPIVTRIVHRYDDLKQAIANVLSFDYIGALIGSLLFPLIFLPYLGFAKTSFLIGFINLSIALINIIIFRQDLKKKLISLWSFSFLIGLFLIVGFLFSTNWIERAREKTSQQKLIYLYHSPYQHIRFIRDNRVQERPYRLYINGEHQFSSNNEHRYHETLVHPAMSASSSRKKILILGGGDGLALRELRHYKEIQKITLVDLDPAMTRFAKQNPIMRQLNQDAFTDKRLQIIHDDALLFVQKTKKKFDVIIIDLPVPTQIALSKLYTVSFYRALRKILHKNGAITTEAATLNPVEKEPFWCLVETQRKAGWRVYPYINETMAYTLMRISPINTTKLKLKVATRHLDNSLLQNAFKIPEDVRLHHTSPINTLDTHRLMYLILSMR